MPGTLDLFASDLVAFASSRCERMLDEVFAKSVWQEGQINECRIAWTDAARHRKSECFRASGIYLWGIEKRPLYVGKTGRSFAHRFNRYIWATDSQCALASRIDPKQTQLPEDVAALLRTKKLRARIDGAARFAKEGITDIWFALFPIADTR
jgi:hypothetical protein